MPTTAFNEPEWIKLIFLLADTRQWLNQLYQDAWGNIPVEKKEKLHRKTWHLTVTARRISSKDIIIKYPAGTGKFHIALPVILHYIREAGSIEPTAIPGCLHLQRVLHTTESVEFDKNGAVTYSITISSDPAGSIITAFPACYCPAIQAANQCPVFIPTLYAISAFLQNSIKADKTGCLPG